MSLRPPHPTFPPRWRLALLAALLAAAQVLLAGHAVGHISEGEPESCDVCLVGGGLGHAALDTAAPAVAPPAHETFTPAACLPVLAAPKPPFRQRGPPTGTPAV